MPTAATPVRAPAGFVPAAAIAFGTLDGTATAVDAANPLPTTLAIGAASSLPLAGSTAASASIGPFTPVLGRPIWLTLSGSWSGTVQVLRSTDGGTTKLPLTIGGQGWASFTANCNEPVSEETAAAATYYLTITLVSGTVGYQVAQ